MNNLFRGVRIDLSFSGKISELEQALVRLGKTHTSNVVIETFKLETVAKSNPDRDVIIHLKFTGEKSELEQVLLSLGKNKTSTVTIDTVPLPEIRFLGD